MTEIERPEVRFAVLDIETTGIDPRTDLILEVGAILLDSNLEEIAQFSCVINDDEAILKMNELRRHAAAGDENAMFVWKMHTQSDLWADMVSTTDIFTKYDAEECLADFLHEHGVEELGTNKSKVTLVGSSIHFDIDFLNQYMPSIPQHFNYRRLDVSGFKVAIDEWKPELKELRDETLSKNKAHRSIPDCEATIAELDWYLHFALDITLGKF